MTRVGIFSDTHGYFNPALFTFFAQCDELWHAGDWGDLRTVEEVKNFKPVRGVYGNIDGREVRNEFPETGIFMMEELKVCMLHIAGTPSRYSSQFRQILKAEKPDILVCGHSHILKVMKDRENNLMYFNPGAAGNKGFHKVCTALRLKVEGKRLTDLEVWEHKRSPGEATNL